MAKKKKEPAKEKPAEPGPAEEKYTLAEHFYNTTTDKTWVIYNLSRKGLIHQLEEELRDYGQKEIKPTLTITEFEEIIKGKQ